MKSFLHTHRRSLVGIGLLAALGTGAYAVAQPAPPRAPDAPSARMLEDRAALRDGHLARREAMREHFEETREARIEGRLAYLKTRLEITEAQTPLWDNFATTLRSHMAERAATRAEPREAGDARPTLLERLEREQARIAARAERLDATAEALIPLYNAFDDAQKETADRVLNRFGENRMAMRDGPGRRGGPRGMRRGPRFDEPRFDEGPFDEPVFDEPLLDAPADEGEGAPAQSL